MKKLVKVLDGGQYCGECPLFDTLNCMDKFEDMCGDECGKVHIEQYGQQHLLL